MKANEFVKLRGISYCKELLIEADGCAAIRAREDNSRVSVDDLKRLIESHELVEIWGGLEYIDQAIQITRYPNRLKQAVLDVESCL